MEEVRGQVFQVPWHSFNNDGDSLVS